MRMKRKVAPDGAEQKRLEKPERRDLQRAETES
jgi:hypothetical protein